MAQPNEESLTADKGTLDNIRLLIRPSSPTFRQLQQIRTFYSFPDTLDVDRYQLPNGRSGAIVATREVDLGSPARAAQLGQRHARVHSTGTAWPHRQPRERRGEPEFFATGHPPVGELEIDQPRVYFGEKSPTYSIVGGPGDHGNWTSPTTPARPVSATTPTPASGASTWVRR